MKVAIFGGGITGLTAAYYLAKKGYKVTIYEADSTMGGLAQGFGKEGWDWKLERTYHHIFSNDHEILGLAKDMGYAGFFFKKPLTASLFGQVNNYRIFPVDSPKDFLLLPELSLVARIKSAFILAFLKICPFLEMFEKMSSSVFLRKTMGEEMWVVMWEQLFRKKFGKYAEKILASFIWARISKRTQNLGYPKGGFQTFIDALEEKVGVLGVFIHKSANIVEATKKEGIFEIKYIKEGVSHTENANIIISTLPYPISIRVMEKILGQNFCDMQKKRRYLYAINLILKTKGPLLDKVYWLNINAKDVPFMCVVQHTNFIESSHYGDKHICYIAWYVEEGSDLLKKTEREMLDFVIPHLKNISPHLAETPEIIGLYKAKYAQPIFDNEFIKIPRPFKTPEKNIYFANMDMTYPYDRGTNYAVKIGKKVADLLP